MKRTTTSTSPSTSAADADLAPLWWRALVRSSVKKHAMRALMACAAVVVVGAAISVYLASVGWRDCQRVTIGSGAPHEECRDVRFYPFTVQRRSQVTTLDGVPNGSRREWHPTGAVWLEGDYLAGLRTGLWRELYPDGTVRFEGTYKDDKLNGMESWYYADGKLEWQVQRVDGKRKGIERWWHENGELRRIGSYEDGEKHGLFETYDEDGELAFTTRYRNGEQVTPEGGAGVKID